jgi:N-acetyl-anhydromuramyl-L-alanine amidase AmpD
VIFGAVCIAIVGALTYPIWSVIFGIGQEQAARAAAKAFLRRLEREPQSVKAELERYGFGTTSDATPDSLRQTIRTFIRNYPNELRHYRQLGIL